MEKEIKEGTQESAGLECCGCWENDSLVVIWKLWEVLSEDVGPRGGGTVDGQFEAAKPGHSQRLGVTLSRWERRESLSAAHRGGLRGRERAGESEWERASERGTRVPEEHSFSINVISVPSICYLLFYLFVVSMSVERCVVCLECFYLNLWESVRSL